MSKVIALQDSQMAQLKDNYNASNQLTTSNADVLSGALGGNESVASQPVFVSSSPVLNMENAPVNLDSGAVNQSVTDQVFGNSTADGSATVNAFAQPAGTTNMFDVAPVAEPVIPVIQEPVSVPTQNIFDVASNSAPVETTISDPMVNIPTSVPAVEESKNIDYVGMINSLRNQIDSFRDTIHGELDKIQEALSAQSPSSQTASTLIDKNLDETMVIPRDIMNNAIAGVTEENA